MKKIPTRALSAIGIIYSLLIFGLLNNNIMPYEFIIGTFLSLILINNAAKSFRQKNGL